MKILMVLTSHDTLGNTGEKTGFWLEEFAAPYYVFKDQGAEVTLASPNGGQPPIDPKSEADDAQTKATERFKNDTEARRQLAKTLLLDTIAPADYDAIFFPGGHGPLWDLSENRHAISLIEFFHQSDKPVGCVCHAPAVLRNVSLPDKTPLVKGKTVTAFSNSEEAAVGLTDVVPFSVEDMLKSKGGSYTKGDDWTSHVEVDGLLVTGQNPASSAAAAEEVIALLKK